MKILFLAQLPPPIHGASIISEKVLNELSKKHNIDFLNITPCNQMSEVGIFSIKKVFISIKIFLKIVKLLISKKFDAIYITLAHKEMAFFKDAIFLLISKFFIKRRIIHLHGRGLRNYVKKGFLKYLKYIIFKLTFYDCEVIHLSNCFKKEVSWLPINKIYIVPNSVKKFTGVENKKKIYDFAFLSNIFEEKGIFVLLDSLQLLKKRKVSFKCLLIGDFKSEEIKKKYYKIINQYNLEDSITFVGPQYGFKKYQYLSQAETFVLPTFYSNEALPLSILESMSLAMPIISTPIGAIKDLIKKNKCGILVKPKDKYSLFQALELICKNKKLLKKYGKNSLNGFNENFTENIFNKRINKIFT